MTALSRKAVGPKMANRIGATANPAPRPSSVAPSKRADALPRSVASPAVTIAMKPRMDGTLAAVDAPSSQRVPPSTNRFVVNAVRMTAIAPNAGPYSITR